MPEPKQTAQTSLFFMPSAPLKVIGTTEVFVFPGLSIDIYFRQEQIEGIFHFGRIQNYNTRLQVYKFAGTGVRLNDPLIVSME